MSIKRRLFAKGAKAIRHLTGVSEDRYVCPLCLKFFFPADLSSGDLTLEHIPPKSTGGRGILLTCRTCNSRAGHSIDVEVIRRKHVIDFVRALSSAGEFAGRIRLEMNGTPTNVNADMKEGALRFVVPKGINDPHNHERVFAELRRMSMDGTWDGQSFNVKPMTSFHPRKALIGDLKTAYLTTFASLGYSYAARPELDRVRAQINDPDSTVMGGYTVSLPDTFPREWKMIGVEKPFKAVAVQIEEKFVFLPPVEPAQDFYTALPAHFQSAASFGKMSGIEWHWPRTLELRLDG